MEHMVEALAPTTPAELAEALRSAAARGRTIALAGNSTKRRMAGPVAPADTAIATSALIRVIEYEPRDLTISVEAGLPWSELTQERAAEDTLSPVCRQRLPAATLQVTVQAAGDPPNEKRILVEIDWQGADGGRSRPVRLTAWRFRSQEARP